MYSFISSVVSWGKEINQLGLVPRRLGTRLGHCGHDMHTECVLHCDALALSGLADILISISLPQEQTYKAW